MAREIDSPRHSRPWLCSITFFILPLVLSLSAQEVHPLLRLGTTVERQLAGGETNAFQIPLTAGQFARVAVDQQGIDIELHLLAPNAQRLVGMDTLNSTQGPEVAAVIAEIAGNYRVEIVSPNEAVLSGGYAVKVETLRTATDSDRKWIVAQQAYLDGRLLRSQQADESKRQAIPRFEEALQQWQAMDDRLMTAHTLYYLSSVYRQLGQLQQSLTHLNQALRLVREIGQRREEAPALTSMGIVHADLGEPRKSLEYYDQALLLWRTFNDAYGEARIFTNQGVAYTLLGEARKALESYSQALTVWQKLGNNLQAADTLTNIGRAYEMLGERQKSLEHYDQAFSLHKAIENRRGAVSYTH